MNRFDIRTSLSVWSGMVDEGENVVVRATVEWSSAIGIMLFYKELQGVLASLVPALDPT